MAADSTRHSMAGNISLFLPLMAGGMSLSTADSMSPSMANSMSLLTTDSMYHQLLQRAHPSHHIHPRQCHPALRGTLHPGTSRRLSFPSPYNLRSPSRQSTWAP